MSPAEAMAAAMEADRRADVDRLTGTPPGTRWLTGPTTRWCGTGWHGSCQRYRSLIAAALATSPCLCRCHAREPLADVADRDAEPLW